MKNNKSVKKFLDLGGADRDASKFLRAIANKEEIEQEILKKYWVLLVKSRYLNEVPYLFLVENMSYAEISEEVKRENLESLSNDTYKNVKKLFKDLGFDPYYDSFNNLRKTEEEYREELEIICSIIQSVGLRAEEVEELSDSLIYPIVEPTEILSTMDNVEQDKFVDIVKSLRFLSIPYLKGILSSVPQDYKNYIMYLLTSDEEELSVHDVANRNLIIQMWWLYADD